MMTPQKSSAYQSGVVLPVVMVALLAILFSGAGLIRSQEATVQTSGKLAFKQDAINQAERAIITVRDLFDNGPLSNSKARTADQLSLNYYSSMQDAHSSGLPEVILDKSNFDRLFSRNNISEDDTQITIRYLIERLCYSPGAVTVENCSTNTSTEQSGGATVAANPVESPPNPVYRISIRANGPSRTSAFLQREYNF